MKKYFVLVVLTLFTVAGCSNDGCNCKDDTIKPIENYSKKIVGKWVLEGVYDEEGRKDEILSTIIKESRNYLSNGSVDVSYKIRVNYEKEIWNEEIYKSLWSIESDIITYSNKQITWTGTDKIISISQNEFKVLTNLARDYSIFSIYNPTDPVSIGDGIKVFRRK